MNINKNRNIGPPLRYTLLYIIITIISHPLIGQMSNVNDTVKIKEVVITRNKFISGQPGYKKTTIDSTVLVEFNSRSLSEMLSENTGIFIKSYGMGGTATPSFRGTGAGHTLLDWNGININSPMLGQSDLSLVQVGLADNIQIFFGGASLLLNNGGLGGTIELDTRPEWKNETFISLDAGHGSFGHNSSFIKVRTGNLKFQTVTKGFYQYAENNFRYLNNEIGSEPVWQTRTNNQVSQYGFLQEFYLRNGKNIASARIWYQSSDRNLPASMLNQQPNSGEKQFDESLRTMLNYDIIKDKSSFSFTGAWIMSRLNYFNRIASIDSRNFSENLTLKAGFENSIGSYTKLKIVIDEQSNVVNSNNYNRLTTRNNTTLTTSIERKQDRLGTSFLLSEILDQHYFLIPDFSAGIQFRLINGKEYFLKANMSRNSKIPAMNDMFWVPGGNPDLKNEYALAYEISFEMNHRISDPLNFVYNLALYRYNIKDMIQWHPGEYDYWTADNIKAVNSTGLESSVSFNYVVNKLKAHLNSGYSFTRVLTGGSKTENDASVGKQLIYMPINQSNTSLRISYGNIYSSWIACFTGKRYIIVDNSKYLPGYLINNFVAGLKLPVKHSFLEMNFNIDNIFNATYQSISYFPLPGRSYFLKIIIQIIK